MKRPDNVTDASWGMQGELSVLRNHRSNDGFKGGREQKMNRVVNVFFTNVRWSSHFESTQPRNITPDDFTQRSLSISAGITHLALPAAFIKRVFFYNERVPHEQLPFTWFAQILTFNNCKTLHHERVNQTETLKRSILRRVTVTASYFRKMWSGSGRFMSRGSTLEIHPKTMVVRTL